MKNSVPDYTFTTRVGYSGSINKKTNALDGNIVIKGGGDPTLGSQYFASHYTDFPHNWIKAITNSGIKKINGRVIADDSYYDYLPVPAKWIWEDIGNYYGAGAYGLSIFDNSYKIHFRTLSNGLKPEITGNTPDVRNKDLTNFLIASGTTDEGYVFSAPYNETDWATGSVPENKEDFILKASISDPPMFIAKMVDKKLKDAGIIITNDFSTARLLPDLKNDEFVTLLKTVSPSLSDILYVMNHESVNLYAEHLIKQMGKQYKGKGTTLAGIEVIKEFLDNAGINTEGLFIEDGSGLSPLNSVSTRTMVDLLFYMKRKSKHFNEYWAFLPDAGEEGTLKEYFRDPVFKSNLVAKSGSMTRVRSFAGYFKANSGREMIFSVIAYNYSGSVTRAISGIEDIIKETILKK